MEKHQESYKIEWIKDMDLVQVEYQCHVPFSYHDEVLYDIVDKGTCHILLGRPWQFYLVVILLGRNNINLLRIGSSLH